MLGIITTILTVILVFLCALMSLIIMMQRPKQEGLGAAFGGGITDRMLGSGTTDFLQKATVFMGVMFFALSLTIATLMAYDRSADRASQLSELKAAGGEKAEATPAPEAGGAEEVAAPEVPAAGVTDLADEAPAPAELDLAAPPIEDAAPETEVPAAEPTEVPADEDVSADDAPESTEGS